MLTEHKRFLAKSKKMGSYTIGVVRNHYLLMVICTTLCLSEGKDKRWDPGNFECAKGGLYLLEGVLKLYS